MTVRVLVSWDRTAAKCIGLSLSPRFVSVSARCLVGNGMSGCASSSAPSNTNSSDTALLLGAEANDLLGDGLRETFGDTWQEITGDGKGDGLGDGLRTGEVMTIFSGAKTGTGEAGLTIEIGASNVCC